MIAPGLRQPPHGGMSPAQAHAIVALHAEGADSASADPPVTAEDAAGGRWCSAGYCATCHMIDGEGGSSAPDLTHVGASA